MTVGESITIIGALIILMGGLFAVVKWGVGIAIDSLRGQMTGQIDGLRGQVTGELEGLRGQVTGELEGIRGEMRASFGSIEKRLDGIDTDVQKLTEKYFGQ